MSVTKVGTSTADSAPAASSSNSTFETEFAAWNVLPRYVVPSTAAITSTRTNPASARDRGHAAHADRGAADGLRSFTAGHDGAAS